MEKKFKLLLLTLGALTLFSACSSVYTDDEMRVRGMMMFYQRVWEVVLLLKKDGKQLIKLRL